MLLTTTASWGRRRSLACFVAWLIAPTLLATCGSTPARQDGGDLPFGDAGTRLPRINGVKLHDSAGNLVFEKTIGLRIASQQGANALKQCRITGALLFEPGFAFSLRKISGMVE